MANQQQQKRHFLIIFAWVFACISPNSSFSVKPYAHKKSRRCSSSSSDDTQLAVPVTLQLSRRHWLVATSQSLCWIPQSSKGEIPSSLRSIYDPNSYSGLLYTPPPPPSANNNNNNNTTKIPLIIFLHGAAKNEQNVWNLADIHGEHAGLLPSLIASQQAPSELLDNFAVLMPYSQGKPSFYDEPRSTLLQFIDWAMAKELPTNIDPKRIYIFGFSDGATLAIELMTTRRFAAGIICSYGFSGILPNLALQRLANLPIWVFHSQDDAIFPVRYSDQLVESLRQVNTNLSNIRYSRFDKDPEGFTGSVRGHTTGITASKAPQVYKWLLTLT